MNKNYQNKLSLNKEIENNKLKLKVINLLIIIKYFMK